MALVTLLVMIVAIFFACRSSRVSRHMHSTCLEAIESVDNLSFSIERDVEELKNYACIYLLFVRDMHIIWKITFLSAAFQALVLFILVKAVHYREKYVDRKSSSLLKFVILFTSIYILLLLVIGGFELGRHRERINRSNHIGRKVLALNCESTLECHEVRDYVKYHYKHVPKEQVTLQAVTCVSLAAFLFLQTVSLIWLSCTCRISPSEANTAQPL